MHSSSIRFMSWRTEVVTQEEMKEKLSVVIK